MPKQNACFAVSVASVTCGVSESIFPRFRSEGCDRRMANAVLGFESMQQALALCTQFGDPDLPPACFCHTVCMALALLGRHTQPQGCWGQYASIPHTTYGMPD